MSSEVKKPTEKRGESKIETRFYDELFKRLQDKNSEEFKDPEAVGKRFIDKTNRACLRTRHNLCARVFFESVKI